MTRWIDEQEPDARRRYATRALGSPGPYVVRRERDGVPEWMTGRACRRRQWTRDVDAAKLYGVRFHADTDCKGTDDTVGVQTRADAREERR